MHANKSLIVYSVYLWFSMGSSPFVHYSYKSPWCITNKVRLFQIHNCFQIDFVMTNVCACIREEEVVGQELVRELVREREKVKNLENSLQNKKKGEYCSNKKYEL